MYSSGVLESPDSHFSVCDLMPSPTPRPLVLRRSPAKAMLPNVVGMSLATCSGILTAL
jgi:hypothetical protein